MGKRIAWLESFSWSGRLFRDGTTLDVTKSTLINYASDTPAVATVGPQGIITPAGPGAANVTVSYGSLSIVVPVTVPGPFTVAPPLRALYSSQTGQFYARVSGLGNPSLVWSVTPEGAGSIDDTGLYTAPSSISTPQMVTVTATNAADGTQFATAMVALYPPASITIHPAAATLDSSQTQP